jgi:putative transposase
MPWQELSVMSQRVEFATRAVLAGDPTSFAELCRQYGISTKTGYKWKQRFLAGGAPALQDQSRRPKGNCNGVGERIVCELVRLRTLHPSWGARKLLEVYQRAYGVEGLPSESSVKRILERSGLVQHRRRRSSEQAGRIQTGVQVEAANDLWTVDFKGWWYARDRGRCEPLTVRDAFSRYVLCVWLAPDAKWLTVRGQFEWLFERYGLPKAIRSDNGRPFAASRAPLGLSQLSAWWVVLGISLDRIAPGKPQQNGAHERMHRDIAVELEGKVDGDVAMYSAEAEVWRNTYNSERPHEGIGMRCPAELYQPSPRKYEGTPEQLSYPAAYLERRVGDHGMIRLHGRYIRLTTAVQGWNVGLEPLGEGVYAVYFATLCLGQVDVARESFTRTDGRSPRPGGADASC